MITLGIKAGRLSKGWTYPFESGD